MTSAVANSSALSTRRTPTAAAASLPNVALAPHLGFVVAETMARFYRDSVENILAYLRDAPIRVANPEALRPRS